MYLKYYTFPWPVQTVAHKKIEDKQFNQVLYSVGLDVEWRWTQRNSIDLNYWRQPPKPQDFYHLQHIILLKGRLSHNHRWMEPPFPYDRLDSWELDESALASLNIGSFFFEFKVSL